MNEIPFELESLSNAKRYQRWLYESVQPYLGRRILELGSGIGNLSQHLPIRDRLILSDIEPHLLKELQNKVMVAPEVSVTPIDPSESLASKFAEENLDTVVSFNVLEHIADDESMLRDILALLRNSGAEGPKRVVTVVPAHQFAFGNIDRSFGHYRRYSRKSFKRLVDRAAADQALPVKYTSFYLNFPALLGWWLNGRVMKKAAIGARNMDLFEILCPVIRPVDTLFLRGLRIPLGNSLVTVIEVPS